ncbi:Imm8 family immunity protein [Vibrio palustris]|uniref:Imm8 family immunity protein n=1 Tax=Vibrio palustris TaxID=1918946 RepID=UPI000984FEDB
MSPDLGYGLSPDYPENCHVLIEAEIGPSESHGADIFYFEVVTPEAIKSLPAPSIKFVSACCLHRTPLTMRRWARKSAISTLGGGHEI